MQKRTPGRAVRRVPVPQPVPRRLVPGGAPRLRDLRGEPVQEPAGDQHGSATCTGAAPGLVCGGNRLDRYPENDGSAFISNSEENH